MYAVISIINGAFKVETEHGDLNSAYISFHSLCGALRNEKSMDVHAVVRIIDAKLNYVIEETIDIVQPKSEQPQEQPQGE